MVPSEVIVYVRHAVRGRGGVCAVHGFLVRGAYDGGRRIRSVMTRSDQVRIRYRVRVRVS